MQSQGRRLWNHRGLNDLEHIYIWSDDDSDLRIWKTIFNQRVETHGRNDHAKLSPRASAMIRTAEHAVRLSGLLQSLKPKIMEHLVRGAQEHWRRTSLVHQEKEAIFATKNRELVACHKAVEDAVDRLAGPDVRNESRRFVELEDRYFELAPEVRMLCKAADEAHSNLIKARERLTNIVQAAELHAPNLDLADILCTAQRHSGPKI